MSQGKGDKQRPGDFQKFRDGWDLIWCNKQKADQADHGKPSEKLTFAPRKRKNRK